LARAETKNENGVRLNKLFILITAALGAFCLFSYNQASENSEIALAYKVERDSLLIANKCPQKLKLGLHAGACLNTKATRHDLDLHVSNLKTAAGDTVGFMPLCDSCFESLAPEARLSFYQRLLGIYDQRNRQDIERQVKDGL
jgi:hypothetical protein